MSKGRTVSDASVGGSWSQSERGSESGTESGVENESESENVCESVMEAAWRELVQRIEERSCR